MALNPRPLRVLIAKPGLDGHDRGARVVANALRDAGMEVIYAGLQQTPQMVANAAIQEDVDVVALSILSGAHMTIFPRVLQLLREQGAGDILVTGGGIINAEDMAALRALGTGRLFGPGASLQEGIAKLEQVFASFESVGVSDRSLIWNTDLVETLEPFLGRKRINVVKEVVHILHRERKVFDAGSFSLRTGRQRWTHTAAHGRRASWVQVRTF